MRTSRLTRLLTRRSRCVTAVLGGLATGLVLGLTAPVVADTTEAQVLAELNATDSVNATDDAKSWQLVFDAWLEASAPPMPIGADFNMVTIHPGMDRWNMVSDWAESNPGVAEAVLAARGRVLFGLPYGENEVDARYRDAGVSARVAPDGDFRIIEFPWLDAMDGVLACTTAETYRLMEAGRTQEALDLMVAQAFLLRQCCDREFRAEQGYVIRQLTAHLENMRDMFHLYYDQISSDQFYEIGHSELPFLRPDRGRLLMPEGDKVVARALLESVFDEGGAAERDRFAEAFATLQSVDEPLTLMGAARRWRVIADAHDSLQSSLERLDLVYDDWWRRWRVQEYDPILDIPSQWDRTNAIRYAAVLYAIEDVQSLFPIRDFLVTSTNGTIMAAGICTSRKRNQDAYPSVQQALYGVTVRRRSDQDPYDRDFDPFKYRLLSSALEVDTPYGRLEVPRGVALLYSIGPDQTDHRGATHSDTAEVAVGTESDIVFWPPIKALQREQGLRP